MKIGIFGGTFNPPHKTHVSIAVQAVKQLKLDKLLVVPCGDPPHKQCEVDKFTRLKLARIAFGSFAEVWDYEILKESKSYTVETLREVKKLYPNAQIYLIIGGDSLNDFDKWYRYEEIATLATLAVAGRVNNPVAEGGKIYVNGLKVNVTELDLQPNDVSSTEIRLRYQFGKDNSNYVPEQVDAYIKERNLYSKYRDVVQKLKRRLSPERFEHTYYVVKRGQELANDGEKDKAFLACLLHDCAKLVPEQDYAKYGFEKPQGMPQPIVHSFLGANVAKRDFGVEDSEILDAIRYHTTGRPNMTRLEKIVYVADKTEQSRPYPLEHLLTGTLDEMFVKCLAEANEYRLEAHGDGGFYLTDETLEFYCLKSKRAANGKRTDD